CAEGVGDAGLREFANPDGAPWVARKISRVIFIAPDDSEVRVAERDVGWILDRTRFDAHLAAEAVAAGAELLVGTEASGMTRTPDGRWHVAVRGLRGASTYRAKVVIGADGGEATAATRASISTRGWTGAIPTAPGPATRWGASSCTRRSSRPMPTVSWWRATRRT